MQTNLFCFSIHLFTLLVKNCRISKHSKKNFTIIQQPKKITLTRFLRTCKHNSPHNICSMDAFPGQNTIPAAPQELHGPGKAVNCSLSCLRAALHSIPEHQAISKDFMFASDYPFNMLVFPTDCNEASKKPLKLA